MHTWSHLNIHIHTPLNVHGGYVSTNCPAHPLTTLHTHTCTQDHTRIYTYTHVHNRSHSHIHIDTPPTSSGDVSPRTKIVAPPCARIICASADVKTICPTAAPGRERKRLCACVCEPNYLSILTVSALTANILQVCIDNSVFIKLYAAWERESVCECACVNATCRRMETVSALPPVV